MTHFLTIINIRRSFYKISRAFPWYLTLLSLSVSLSGCGTVDAIDNAISEINKTRTTIAGQSSAWRNELPKLVDKLKGIEGQAAQDVKGILTDATNQVQDLAIQTLDLSEAKANEILGNVNAYVLCDADFVKDGVREQLQYLVDDLQFWKQNNRHLDKKPYHHVCVINPSALSLYPIDQSGNVWAIDTSNMSDPNIMQVFGYNFWPETVPDLDLELQDANGHTVRVLSLRPAYVTRYQINLDFSNEDFAGAQDGARLVFKWPDQADPNTISLILKRPAKLEISDPSTWVFIPSAPRAQQDLVTLKVKITNVGGSRSGNFHVYWKPDPWDNDTAPVSITAAPLNPGEFEEYNLSAYKYRRSGTISSLVYLDTGDAPQNRDLVVAEPELKKLQQTIHWEQSFIRVTSGDIITKKLLTLPEGCQLDTEQGGEVLQLAFAQVQVPLGFSLNFLLDNYAKNDITYIEYPEKDTGVSDVSLKLYYVKIEGLTATDTLRMDVTVYYRCPP